MVRGSRLRLFVAALLVPLGLVVMAPSAHAASRVVGCFSYAGTRYQGLATQLEWRDTPPRATTLQDEWLADMTARGSCNSSPAAQVACYMDNHGLVGNVVTRNRDSDGDGTIDGYDNYPNNLYYH
jgi:hypothetical protein